MTSLVRVCVVTSLLLCTGALCSPSAEAAQHVQVYTGRVGGHGSIRIDVKRGRARVYFNVSCQSAQGGQPELLSTGEGVQGPGNISPLSGHVRRGRLAIKRAEEVEEHDEAAAGNPEVSIVFSAHVTSGRVSGQIALQQSEVAGLGLDPSLSIPACTTGILDFVARRRVQ
jgi:hypothetical protein